jgi:hypothetical protein
MNKRIHLIKGVVVGLTVGLLIINWSASGTSADSALEERARVSFVSDAASDSLMEFSPQLLNMQAGQQEQTVEQKYKNIQVLKGLPESQLFVVMNFMRSSLGVSCAYCHVYGGGDKWEWEKDDKPAKRTARKMMQMVMDINKTNFEGRHAVSCYTCHRGSTEPAVAPPLPQAAPEGGPGGMKPAVTLPKVDEVLEKYVQALGGRAAIEKAKTRVLKGAQVSSANGASMPLEIAQQAPNKFVMTLTTPQQAVIARGYNGTTAWMKTPRGQRELSGADLEQMKRNADFFWMLKLREVAKEMFVMGKEKIGERETYVVGAMVAPARIEKFYFDTQTGLLLRAETLEDTLIGWIPEQLDYEDYREVDGVKMPFTVRQSYVDPWIGWTRKFTEIKVNAPVDEAKFNIPTAK